MMIHFLLSDSVSSLIDLNVLDKLINNGAQWCVSAGGRVIAAIAIYIVGRYVIKFVNKVVAKLMSSRNIDASIQGFLKSLINITLTALVIIAVISKLGIETTSFAAILASVGVAVGMAMSGNLQNFAGGIVILVLRPYRVGDFIEASGVTGTVREIQIFHTIIQTGDNKLIYIPNGSLSNGTVVNYSREETRRVEWTIGVEYGQDYDKAAEALKQILAEDSRILKTPEPFIALSALDASSVNIMVRAWVNAADYWDVYFDMNKHIYQRFNELGIGFPFPSMTVYQGK